MDAARLCGPQSKLARGAVKLPQGQVSEQIGQGSYYGTENLRGGHSVMSEQPQEVPPTPSDQPPKVPVEEPQPATTPPPSPQRTPPATASQAEPPVSQVVLRTYQPTFNIRVALGSSSVVDALVAMS